MNTKTIATTFSFSHLNRRFGRFFSLLSTGVVFFLSGYGFAETEIENWAEHDESSIQVIDHRLWQGVLDQAVVTVGDGINRFDYGALSSTYKIQLNRYIQQLSTVEVAKLSRNQQLAFWINLYNAVTVQLVVENYPTSSIRKLGKALFSFGPWDDQLVSVKGERLSLNDIEHNIIRPIFKDKRIHYAVNCASLGCPNLSAVAFDGSRLDQQLNGAACEFISHPRAVSFDGNKLKLSSIYKWYLDDFGDDVKALIPHLLECVDEETRIRLEKFEPTRRNVKYHYDWKLNDVKRN